MTIVLDIKPDIQAELARQAAAHGVRLEPYAASLLEEAVRVGPSRESLTEERLDEALRELARFSYKIPVLPDEAFSRESLYQDHD